MNESAMISSAF